MTFSALRAYWSHWKVQFSLLNYQCWPSVCRGTDFTNTSDTWPGTILFSALISHSVTVMRHRYFFYFDHWLDSQLYALYFSLPFSLSGTLVRKIKSRHISSDTTCTIWSKMVRNCQPSMSEMESPSDSSPSPVLPLFLLFTLVAAFSSWVCPSPPSFFPFLPYCWWLLRYWQASTATGQ